MKLIIENNRIAATAIDEHQGTGAEQAIIQAPEDFDLSRMADYRFEDGEVRLPVVTMAAASRQALETAMAYGNAITAGELNQWAGVEPLSWTQQREEALKVRAEQELDAFAVLPGLAEDKGISLAAYAEDVLFNADRMQRVLRAAVYLRRSATTRLLDEALDTPEKLAAVVDALRVEADALAAQLLAADEAAAAERAA